MKPKGARKTEQPRERRSACAVSSTLDLFGDRWTLIVIRDLTVGKRRYGELMSSQEGIPTNILADRLRRLEEAEVIERRLYQEHPPRHEYHLTAKGRDLLPVLQAMARWSLGHVADTSAPSGGFMEKTPDDLADD